jgi:hypothetical protein
VRADLVDRREARAEPAARRAEVDPPDPDALLAREPHGLLETILKAREPVGQDLGVVGGEALDVVGREAAKIEEAGSRIAREGVIDFYDHTLSTRLNARHTGAIVIVSQRLHERDLAGHLLDRGGYQHLCLPAEYDPQHPHLSEQDPRRTEGEPLWPAMYDRSQLEELKQQLGPHATASQLQQLPAPHGGAIFPRSGWRWYDPDRPLVVEDVIVSVDLALTNGPHSDYCVAEVWGTNGAHSTCYAKSGQSSRFIEQIQMIREISSHARHYNKDRPPAVYIENAASAAPLIQMLGSEIPALIPITPRGDKTSRAMAIAPQLHAGNIHLPGAANARRQTTTATEPPATYNSSSRKPPHSPTPPTTTKSTPGALPPPAPAHRAPHYVGLRASGSANDDARFP